MHIGTDGASGMISDPYLLPLAQASAATYLPTSVPKWQNAVKTVSVYLSTVNGIPSIDWEGTHDFVDWVVDLMAIEIPFEHDTFGPVHVGMMGDVISVVNQIAAYLEGLGWPPYLNDGHSKGGGEAILFHAEMKLRGHPPLATRAYEPPQVGGAKLRDYLSGENIAWTTTNNIHGRDIVPQCPFGPTWAHCNDPIILTVPDALGIPGKHSMAAVLASLAAT